MKTTTKSKATNKGTSKAKTKAAARTKAESESPKESPTYEPTRETDKWFEFSGVLPATITRENGFGCRVMTLRAFAERYLNSTPDDKYEADGRMVYRTTSGNCDPYFELPEWMDSTHVTLPRIAGQAALDEMYLVGLKEDIEKIEELMDVHLNAVLDIRRLMAK